MYVIQFTDDGLANVKALPKSVRNSLKAVLQQRLSNNPEGRSVELEGLLAGWRSFHGRKYRIVFKVYEDLKTIAIGGVGERQPGSQADIYRKLEALAASGKLAENVLRVLRGFSHRPPGRGQQEE